MTERRQFWLFEYEKMGAHTHVTVRCGPQDHSRAKAGDLVLENEEWDELQRMILAGHVALGLNRAEDSDRPYVQTEFRSKGLVEAQWDSGQGVVHMPPMEPGSLSDEEWLESLADAKVPEEGEP